MYTYKCSAFVLFLRNYEKNLTRIELIFDHCIYLDFFIWKTSLKNVYLDKFHISDV